MKAVITKDQYDEIMSGIIKTANQMEKDNNGIRLTYEESKEIARKALRDNEGLTEFIIKHSGARGHDCLDWLTSQF